MLLAFLAACSLPQSLAEHEAALAARLAEVRRERPDSNGPALEAWDRRYFDAHWEHLTALFRLAEAGKEKALWERVVREFTAFIWEREDDLSALQARLYVARAHQALEAWGPCFAQLRDARVLDRPENRKDPRVVEIATRSLIVELQARLACARGYEVSLRSAESHLKAFARDAESELFLRLRLETARVLHAARRPAEAEKILQEIRTRHAGTEPGDRALELLAGLLGREVEAFADGLFRKHHFTEALGWYGRLPKSPRAWHRLGECYTRLRRFYEAALALEQACREESPERLGAALLLEQVLRQLVDRLQDPSQKSRLAAHREWMRRTLDFAKAGARATLLQADALLREGRYAEAARWYGKLKPGDPGHEEAVHSKGYCHFRLEEYERAAADFRAYLEFPGRIPRSADTALDLAAWSLLHLGKAEETLALTEAARPADAALAQWRLAHRADAFARLGRFREAEEALAAMNEEVASRPLIRALERMAAGYEAALRKAPDPALWGRYARLVVRLSEKTYRPLRGEKLLAAADALLLEATPEASGLAFELYAQYLLSQTLRDDERHPVLYRQAQAAAGAGKLERARDLAGALSSADPAKGSYRELEADLNALLADRLPRGAERNALLDRAIRVYAELSTTLGSARQDEPYFRLLSKYAARLFERDPEQARRFFDVMEKRGYGTWDGDRWGYRTKMDALKAKVLQAVPARR